MDILKEIQRCTECETCMDACASYKITGDPLFSPMHRLKTAESILSGTEPDDRLKESMYNCSKCLKCQSVCPEEIRITDVVHAAREELSRQGWGPLEGHEKVIAGILKTGNSVNGDPAKRLEWLPGEFPKNESDTLLYMGCLPSYLVKDSAASTYLVLKKLGVDFMLIEDEGCCGTYLYESGKRDLAAEYFRNNAERFASLGIKHLIVPCNGCLKCFKYFYPEVLGSIDFTVTHALEVIYNKLSEDPSVLTRISGTVTYQDPCRLARGEKMTAEPRKLLEMCGLTIEEPAETGDDASCCGAGAGMRSVYRDLSTEIAASLLASAPADNLATACPFCSFNLNYTSKKKELGKRTEYFTNYVLKCLE